MKEQEGHLIYGMLTRIDSSIKQALYYLETGDKEVAKHFINDVKFTAQSLKGVVDKIKFSET